MNLLLFLLLNHIIALSMILFAVGTYTDFGLLATGKKDEARLISFLCDHTHQTPKTTLRYSMETLSKQQKELIKA
jgi:hypothetical protein